jgi:hypothetical protein
MIENQDAINTEYLPPVIRALEFVTGDDGVDWER